MEEEIFIELSLTEKQTRVLQTIMRQWLQQNEDIELTATYLRAAEIHEALKSVPHPVLVNKWDI
jgi:hypothetical protein